MYRSLILPSRMYRLRCKGWSCVDIGERFGYTRQYVFQRIKDYEMKVSDNLKKSIKINENLKKLNKERLESNSVKLSGKYILDERIDNVLVLKDKTKNALTQNAIITIKDLLALNMKELYALNALGETGAHDVHQQLARIGLQLKED